MLIIMVISNISTEELYMNWILATLVLEIWYMYYI